MRTRSWRLRSAQSERLLPPAAIRNPTYRTPHYSRFIPSVAVPRPFGYLVTQTDIATKLAQHSIGFSTLAEPVTLDVESSIVTSSEKTTSPDICTGIERFETVLSVRKERRTVRFEAGTLFVPTGQRLGNLIVYLLEPEADDGLARWEFFDPSVRVGEPFPVYRLPRPTKLPERKS
jgi:hypothetical protein